VLLGITAAVWLALGRLAVAFVANELDWRYVAEQSRVDAPWYYRLAGVWGGMDGSLLLFTGILGAVAVLAVRRSSAAVRWWAAGTVGALTLIDLTLASPFGRLDAPAVRGFGLTPILEHPAMTVHPPLLYLGLAAAFGAFLVGLDGEGAWSRARPWLLATIGVLTLAMTLGGVWSYVEQGWGGYWAWDPVENTSLIVWLAAIVAVHGAPVTGARWIEVALVTAPWVLALAGATIVRSGLSPSVHGFAEQASVGWALLAVSLLTAVAAAVVAVRARSAATEEDAPTRRPAGDRAITVVLAAAATLLVVVGTVVPVLTELAGGRATAVRGEFFARTVGPLALVAIPFLLRRFGRRGWSTVAHAGMLVLLVGVAASTFDRRVTVPVPAGATVEAAGRAVRNDGVEVVEGPRPGTDAVVADLDVAGRTMRPALVVYPDRGGRLAETAVASTPLTDVQVVLEDAADDGGVVVTVHVRHLMWLVWVGAAVVAVATLAAARRPEPA
jgi:cytochrome c-type biogenesis protein CcmF